MSVLGPEPGSEVLLIVRELSYASLLIEADATRVAVRVLGDRPLTAACAQRITLVGGRPGARVTAHGRLAVRQGPDAEFVLESPWTALNRRASDRYPARLRAGIRQSGDLDEAFAVTLDVSLGGAAVEVLEDPGVDRVELSTGFADDPPFVPCEVVSRRHLKETTILHLRFDPADAEQRRHVDSLVRVVQEMDQAA